MFWSALVITADSAVQPVNWIWYARAVLLILMLLCVLLMLAERWQSARAEVDAEAEDGKWSRFGRGDDPGNPFK